MKRLIVRAMWQAIAIALAVGLWICSPNTTADSYRQTQAVVLLAAVLLPAMVGMLAFLTRVLWIAFQPAGSEVVA